MRPIQEILPLVVPQRWTAYALQESICEDRKGNKKSKYMPSVKRVSAMLKQAAANGKLTVNRRLNGERLEVWYEGPPDAFNDIRLRA
jgi:hypothetical protein